jgi:hypothetical protein
MRWAAEGLGRRVGFRGSALLFFALLDLIYGFSLVAPSREARQSATLRLVADIAPLWAWAALWTFVGLVCLGQAFRRRDQVAFTMAIGIKVLWGLTMLGGWLLAGLDRGYVSAAVWLALAALVGIIGAWPEPPHGWKERAWTQPSA